MSGNFKTRIELRFEQGAYLCVGLDPTPEQLSRLGSSPGMADIVDYLVGLVEAVSPYAAAFKPNRAFYERMSPVDGHKALHCVVNHIKTQHPDIPVILDNKLGDIATTNEGYVAMVDRLGADALTLHPYLGSEGMRPFLDKDRYSFVLCKTSNPGSGQFQDVDIFVYYNNETGYVYGTKAQYAAAHNDSLDHMAIRKMPMYLYVAHRVDQDWQMGGGAGLVVGATYPKHLREVLESVAGMVILVPGVGTQGGDPSEAFEVRDDSLILVNASSSIMNAPDPAEAAFTLNEQLEEWVMA